MEKWKDATSKKGNILLQALRNWAEEYKKITQSKKNCIKNGRNVCSKRDKKQYCHIYLSELWNETRLLKAKFVNLKNCDSAKSKPIQVTLQVLRKRANKTRLLKEITITAKNCKNASRKKENKQFYTL